MDAAHRCGGAAVNGAWLRQFWSDLLAQFWLRPALMTLTGVILAAALIRTEGAIELPDWAAAWVYAGGVAGARDVLGTIAAASIGVAGTTFSITVAALSLASSQMGPRLLQNFTRDPGNQYALGTFVATFAYSLLALRSVREAEEGAFVPQLAVSGALLLAVACAGVLIWFLNHIASSINVDRVVALVRSDLVHALQALPARGEAGDQDDGGDVPAGAAAPLHARGSGYLRVLDEGGLVDWAAGREACIRLMVRPGGFVFPGMMVGTVTPAHLRGEAETALGAALSLGDTRNVTQDLEYAVRQLVEVGMRALSAGTRDPFTAISVLDQLGAALCETAAHDLPGGRIRRDGVLRLERSVTDYDGLVDAMFHMLRQAGTSEPAVSIHLVEVLAAVAAVERDPARLATLRRHLDLAWQAGMRSTEDETVRAAIAKRHADGLAAIAGRGARAG
ncbi:DUF2254 domain-containing protein [Falsiroseomonas bella]|uniref:DUF2254 domain-containing protein n=1 Tax=Falsiroseomonas bella TaxID=2184016 RepID=A0A317FBT4_9PROT|nr:DUF2254 domain-containing protein [Falsiroseomonas bella]PWS35467.1 DUF2254 domain-containing protein [Falsiroseomonas bella]